MTPVLIFVHLEKTAGSTMREILSQEYGRRGFFYDNWWGRCEFELAKRCQAGDCPDAIWGHFKYFGIGEHLNRPCEYFTLLRDPVQRFVSYYNHQLRKERSKLYDLIWQEGVGLRRMLQPWANQHHNHYVRWLSGKLCGELCQADMDRALWALDQCSLLGFTWAFDKLFRVLKGRYGWVTESYKNRHVRGSGSLFDKIDLGLIREIEEANSMDVELYQHALEKWKDFYEWPE